MTSSFTNELVLRGLDSLGTTPLVTGPTEVTGMSQTEMRWSYP